MDGIYVHASVPTDEMVVHNNLNTTTSKLIQNTQWGTKTLVTSIEGMVGLRPSVVSYWLREGEPHHNITSGGQIDTPLSQHSTLQLQLDAGWRERRQAFCSQNP